jgi:hypothetical protein
MANKKFEEIMEYVVNGETDKAEALFHEAIVDMSREIYENMFNEELSDIEIDETKEDDEEEMDESSGDDSDDEEMDEAIGGDASDDMMQDVEAGSDGEQDDEEGDEAESDDSDEAATKGDIMDLESEIQSLKAAFEKMQDMEADEPFHSDDMSGDDMGGEEPAMDMGMDKKDENFPAFEEEIEEVDLSPAALMREYVDKVGETYKGGKVASSSETGSPNTKSIVAGKNNMGGTTANIAKGGTGSEKGTAGGLLNPSTKPQDGGNVNVPGAKSATKLHPVSKGHGAEKKGAGEQATNKKSLIGSK